MNTRLALVGSFLIAVAALCAPAEQVWAKTPGYILTGGDLGDHALHFYTDDYLEMPGPHVLEVAPPDSWPGVAYLLYDTWPFAAAAEAASGEPLAYLYPATRLVHNPASGAWLQLDDTIWQGAERWSGVKKALDAARSNVDVLPKGVVMASLNGRGFDLAWWDVFSGTFAELVVAPVSLNIPLAVYRRGLDPRIGPDGAPARRLNPGEFPLEEFAAAIGSPPLEDALIDGATFAYGLNVSAPTSMGSWHAPAFMYYAPPTAERGGRIWEGMGSGRAGTLPRVWASTPEFDRRFEDALRTAEARAAAPSTDLSALSPPATDTAADRDNGAAVIVAGVVAATAATITALALLRFRARANRA
ncbi:MAG TPA: hypothetical protein VNN10_07220 [Dehalococcoidia bacterium]|nr:hypothetical protein [Dehalococcoidia bacterium]